MITRTFLLASLLISSLFSVAQKANSEEIELLMDRHNAWRAEVGVNKLTYSEELAEVANQWAIQLKKESCAFKHSQNSYGENLFKGTSGYYTVGDAIDAWGNEKKDFDYKKNQCKKDAVCGHYTQVIWKATTEVGCAKNICNDIVTWVCNYNPPGNFIGVKPY